MPAKKKAAPKKEWTKARWHAFVVAVLRSGTRRFPPKYECLNAAKTEKRINTRTGRLAQHYLCSACNNEFPATNVQVDHIEPVVGSEGFSTWDTFIERLFCAPDNLAVLCKECHKIKSKQEQQERKKQKNANSSS